MGKGVDDRTFVVKFFFVLCTFHFFNFAGPVDVDVFGGLAFDFGGGFETDIAAVEFGFFGDGGTVAVFERVERWVFGTGTFLITGGIFVAAPVLVLVLGLVLVCS
jgi:hypothetical protein